MLSPSRYMSSTIDKNRGRSIGMGIAKMNHFRRPQSFELLSSTEINLRPSIAVQKNRIRGDVADVRFKRKKRGTRPRPWPPSSRRLSVCPVIGRPPSLSNL